MMGDPSSLSTNPLGTVLLGRYRIVRELAKGGMGVVYLARSEGAVGFVKPVVVKLVLPEHSGDRRFVSMFAREAQILSNLRHASIVDVVEFGEQDGAYIMVLEYVRGYHLGQWSKYLRLKGRSVEPAVALQIVIDVLDALDHAHSMQHPDGSSMHIVHRDVSPSNILLDEDGRARLLDFGVARMRGGDFDYQTQVKGFVGKLIYSAPEIFAEGDATPRSDCYACAVVLHETLLGRNTFRADTQAQTLNRVLNHAPESLESTVAGVPQGLDAVLEKAMAKSAEERFVSARAFASALRALSPEPENDVRARLSEMLKNDFGREMAELLGLESLSDRDEAWRRLNGKTNSSAPPPRPLHEALDPSDGGSSQLSAPVITKTELNPTTLGPTTVEMRRGALGLRESGITLRPPPAQLEQPSSYWPTPEIASVKTPVGLSSSPRPKVSSHIVWAAALVGVAGLTALYFGAEPKNTSIQPPAKIRVVSSTTSIQPTPKVEALPATPRPEVAPLRSDATSRARSGAGEARTAPRGESMEQGSPEARRLTRAFGKQQGRIEACFVQHAVDPRSLPPLQFEFVLDAEGKLSSAQVAPQGVANTPLGKCLTAVASQTEFPAQGKPLTFSIPLLTTRTAPTPR
jgi:eukaryotic-like serine/threonine-protein kinase